jgi:hypothetical protein
MSDNRLPEYLGQLRLAETNSCNSVTRIIKTQCDSRTRYTHPRKHGAVRGNEGSRQHRAEVQIAVADLRSNPPAGFISALAGL